MKRIIQKYQEGGVVQPAVNTGVPQGGNAASAIESYLSGNVSSPSSYTAGPLSYTPGGSGTPDYKALAAQRGRLRKELAATGAPMPVQILAMRDADTDNLQHLSTRGSSSTNPGDVAYTGNTPGQMSNASYTPSNGLFSGGGADGEGRYGIVGDIGGGFRDLASGILDNSIIGRGYSALTGKDLIGKYVDPGSPDGTSYFSGGGADGEGRFGRFGDFLGGIGDSLGVTNYDGSNPPTSSESTYTPYEPSAAAAKYAAYQKAAGGSGTERHAQNKLNSVADKIRSLPKGSPEAAALAAANGLTSLLNEGGPIGLNAGGPSGGISVANTGLREDEIRQRQMMQAQIQPKQKSPLSGIGESLMMGAVDNGINTGLATLASKEGLAGTLGTMMGSGGVGATAATGGLGAGMMAALGPVGIGLGLGKLFGVFNDGGKVPCSCGKTPCKCAKGKKSPLSGE